MFNGQTPTTQMKAALWLESQPELVSHCFPIQKVKAKGPKESTELKFFTQNRFYEIVHSGLRNAKDSDQGAKFFVYNSLEDRLTSTGLPKF